MKTSKQSVGYSLIELLISLTIGVTLVQLAANVYDSNTKLYLHNKALTQIVQNGQFVMALFNHNVEQAGLTNPYLVSMNSTDLNLQIDIKNEVEFLEANPIAHSATFDLFTSIKSTEGGVQSADSSATPDQIVINTIADKSCTGSHFDFIDDEQFHIVDHYYLSGTTLRCKSYDGRYLRGLKPNGASNYSVSLMEGVHDLQVQYAVQQLPSKNVSHTRWVNADELANLSQLDFNVVAVNISALVGVTLSDQYLSEAGQSDNTSVKLLNNQSYQPKFNTLTKVFETTIRLNRSI